MHLLFNVSPNFWKTPIFIDQRHTSNNSSILPKWTSSYPSGDVLPRPVKVKPFYSWGSKCPRRAQCSYSRGGENIEKDIPKKKSSCVLHTVSLRALSYTKSTISGPTLVTKYYPHQRWHWSCGHAGTVTGILILICPLSLCIWL